MPFLLNALRRAYRLGEIWSLPIPLAKRAFLLARHFHPNREIWRRNYYFSDGYRNALARLAQATHYEDEVAVQVGALFSLPQAFPTGKCLSLHDGNFAERVESGYASRAFSRAKVEEILRIEEETAQRMSAICTLSEYLRRSFITNYRVDPARVFNVGGAVNLREVPDEDATKDYTNRRILFIGSEFERKGGSILLAAFEVLHQWMPDAELHIVGPKTMAQVQSNVVFHGHLSKRIPEQNALLERLFRDSSLFVLPSLYEPFGIAPLEAMLYGMPCIVTNAWALGEMVSQGVTGALVEKGSIEDLAHKMRDLLLDPDQLRVMGQNGRAKVLANHMWSNVADRLGSVMDRLS